jgi:hypothetical protein
VLAKAWLGAKWQDSGIRKTNREARAGVKSAPTLLLDDTRRLKPDTWHLSSDTLCLTPGT